MTYLSVEEIIDFCVNPTSALTATKSISLPFGPQVDRCSDRTVSVFLPSTCYLTQQRYDLSAGIRVFRRLMIFDEGPIEP